jgi:hypothetical protein
LLASADVLPELSSSVETMVRRRSWPIGGRNCGKHGPKLKTLQNDEFGRLLGKPGETGVSFTLGKVYGVDGLRVGDCVGGAGIGPVGTDGCCACALSIKTQTPNITAHPLSKSCASAIRIAVVVVSGWLGFSRREF